MPMIIAIAGGSCSGKTTLAKKIAAHLGSDRCQILFQDSFYFDQSKEFDHDGGSVNFDHPNAIDFALMQKVLTQLRQFQAVQIPIYDFKTHQRIKQSDQFEVKDYILVDGTLILSQQNLHPLFDFSYFIECSSEDRLSRRLKRDVEERGRTPQGVKDQFCLQVEPMHKTYVEPSKKFAGRIFQQDELGEADVVETLLSEWSAAKDTFS